MGCSGFWLKRAPWVLRLISTADLSLLCCSRSGGVALRLRWGLGAEQHPGRYERRTTAWVPCALQSEQAGAPRGCVIKQRYVVPCEGGGGHWADGHTHPTRAHWSLFLVVMKPALQARQRY